MLGFLSRLFSPGKTRCAPQSCLDVVAGWLGIARLGRSPPGTAGQRRHRRWFLGRALIIEVDGKSIEGETVDISAGGAGLLLRTPLAVGARVRLRDPDGRTRVPARVVYNALMDDEVHFRVGVEFVLDETDGPAAPTALTDVSPTCESAAAPPAPSPVESSEPVVARPPPDFAPPAPAPVAIAVPAPPTDKLSTCKTTPATPTDVSCPSEAALTDVLSGSGAATTSAQSRGESGAVPPAPSPVESSEPVEVRPPSDSAPPPPAITEQPAAATPATDGADALSERWWIPRGPAVTATPAATGAAPLSRDLVEFAERVIQHAELHLPMLPQVLQRALVMAQSEDVDFNRLAKLLEADAALTANILRRANSAESAPVDRITRLPEALARLGRRRIVAIMGAAAVKRVTLEATGLDPQRALQIWHTSAAAAAVMHVAARRFGLPEEEAALIGLLHDLGVLAALRIAHLYRESYDSRLSAETVERLCAEWHEPLGQALATAWKLQAPLPELCGDHHAAPAAGDELARHRHLVQFADVVCALLEYAPYVPYDLFKMPGVRALGITDDPDWQTWLETLPAAIADRTGDL